MGVLHPEFSVLVAHKAAVRASDVGEVFRKLAIEQGKSIHYEMASFLEFSSFMASMSDRAQSQYIAWLLDYTDERDGGAYHNEFDWVTGKAATRSLDRMRTRYPQLYEVMQVQRNAWWTKKIDELLSMGNILHRDRAITCARS